MSVAQILAMAPADEAHEEKGNRNLWITMPREIFQGAWLLLKEAMVLWIQIPRSHKHIYTAYLF